MVPPTTRPSGYHAVGSNQFQKACTAVFNNEGGHEYTCITHVEAIGREDLGCSAVVQVMSVSRARPTKYYILVKPWVTA